MLILTLINSTAIEMLAGGILILQPTGEWLMSYMKLLAWKLEVLLHLMSKKQIQETSSGVGTVIEVELLSTIK